MKTLTVLNTERLMPFGEAFELTKDYPDVAERCVVHSGHKIRRKSWPAGQFVAAQTVQMSPVQFRGRYATVSSYLCLVTPTNTRTGQTYKVNPWTPTQEDLFAEDWKVEP